MADSLCCAAETNTTLLINYTPIEINLKKDKHPCVFFALLKYIFKNRQLVIVKYSNFNINVFIPLKALST